MISMRFSPAFVLVFCFFSVQLDRLSADDIPNNATHCSVSAPIRIELVPTDEPREGQTAHFDIRVNSDLDPALVQKMWVDHELSGRLRIAPGFSRRLAIARRRGLQHYRLGVEIPDRKRHEIRARLMVQLVDGTTIAHTAVRYVDLGKNPPDGMIGRVVDSDGTGIRIYEGKSLGD